MTIGKIDVKKGANISGIDTSTSISDANGEVKNISTDTSIDINTGIAWKKKQVRHRNKIIDSKCRQR